MPTKQEIWNAKTEGRLDALTLYVLFTKKGLELAQEDFSKLSAAVEQAVALISDAVTIIQNPQTDNNNQAVIDALNLRLQGAVSSLSAAVTPAPASAPAAAPVETTVSAPADTTVAPAADASVSAPADTTSAPADPAATDATAPAADPSAPTA